MVRFFALFAGLALILMARAALAACSCTGMSVAHADAAQEVYCTDENFEFEECIRVAGGADTACPETNYVYTCPVGVNSQNWGVQLPQQKTGFGVTATLAGDDDSQCTTGQLLTLTITGDNFEQPKNKPTSPTGVRGELVAGVLFDVDNDPANPMPQFPIGDGTETDPKFGGDNYRFGGDLDALMLLTDGRYRWWDNTDQGKDSQAENASWRYKFVSFVRGSAPEEMSCACAFDIAVDWSPDSDPVTTYVQDMTYSNGCAF